MLLDELEAIGAAVELTAGAPGRLYGLPDLETVRFEVAAPRKPRAGARGRPPSGRDETAIAAREDVPPAQPSLAWEHQQLTKWEEVPAVANLDRLISETDRATRRAAAVMLLDTSEPPILKA